MKSLTDDKRKIEQLWFDDTGVYKVGGFWFGETITKIEAYNENGQMALVPWFAIFIDNKPEPRIRIPATAITGVSYIQAVDK